MPNHQEIRVSDIMSSRPISVNEDDPLSLVISLFERARISGAPVINHKGEYTGVLSKTDLTGSQFFKLLQEKGYDKLFARDVMTAKPPITVKEDTLVRQAIQLMLDKHVHRVFIKNGIGKIIGVVSSFDVMKVIELQEATATPAKAPATPERDRELRFFSLVSQKQGEFMQTARRSTR